MKYALLGYDREGALEQLDAPTKRALHKGHRALHKQFGDGSVSVVAHYRFRPTPLATIGAASEMSAPLRALYILDSDDADAVIQFAEQLPAALHGATVEIWPLT